MLILDVEKQTGLDRATIRFYEKEGIIVPSRSDNGYRSYTEENVQLLLKVKLLRQLGVSLYKIKALQQGSGSLLDVLTEQINTLEMQIRENTAAKIVCQQMQQDGVEYTTLNSLYYLDMLSKPAVSTKWFSEANIRECHPWRRYFARYLDYCIVTALLELIIIVLIRIRPFGTTAIDILGYGARLLAVPVFATLLHYFGTTPGKWAMGIRLESVNGGRLSGGEALYREGKILWHGIGLFIPIFSVWRLYRSYKEESNGEEQPWNVDTEIVYSEWTVCRKLIATGILVLSLSVSVFAGFDSVKPRYIGKTITISEFSKNFQDYEKLYGRENEYIMDENGKWEERNTGSTGYTVIGGPYEMIRPDFTYKVDGNGNILEIAYENNWDDANFQNALPHYCQTALEAVVGSQPGSSYKDLLEIENQLVSNLYSKLSNQSGDKEGIFSLEGVTVIWSAEIENCESVYYGMLFAQDEAKMPYHLNFRIRIG